MALGISFLSFFSLDFCHQNSTQNTFTKVKKGLFNDVNTNPILLHLRNFVGLDRGACVRGCTGCGCDAVGVGVSVGAVGVGVSALMWVWVWCSWCGCSVWGVQWMWAWCSGCWWGCSGCGWLIVSPFSYTRNRVIKDTVNLDNYVSFTHSSRTL